MTSLSQPLSSVTAVMHMSVDPRAASSLVTLFVLLTSSAVFAQTTTRLDLQNVAFSNCYYGGQPCPGRASGYVAIREPGGVYSADLVDWSIAVEADPGGRFPAYVYRPDPAIPLSIQGACFCTIRLDASGQRRIDGTIAIQSIPAGSYPFPIPGPWPAGTKTLYFPLAPSSLLGQPIQLAIYPGSTWSYEGIYSGLSSVSEARLVASGSLGAPAPPTLTIDLVDPVPSLLSGAAVTTAPCALSTGGRDVRGVAADGVAQIVVRVHTPATGDSITLSLSNPAGGDAGSLAPVSGGPPSTVVTVTATCSDPDGSGGLAFALYRAPLDFASTTAQQIQSSRIVELSAAGASGGHAQQTLGVVRPPVVLVHGYASNAAETWKDILPPASNTAPFKFFRVNYGNNLALAGIVPLGTSPFTGGLAYLRKSHLGFSWNVPGVARQIAEFIRAYAGGENDLAIAIASVQADIVAHSMGGLVMRYWTTKRDEYLVPVNFNQGYINKLITIGTPHFGSPQAILSLEPDAWCSRGLGADGGRHSFETATLLAPWSSAVLSSEPGASGELRGDGIGAYLSTALDEIKARALPLPTAMIGGDIGPLLGNIDDSKAAVALRLLCPGDVLAQRYTSTAFRTVFDPGIRPGDTTSTTGGAASDGAVPLTSAFRSPSVTTCSGPMCGQGVAHGEKTGWFFSPSTRHLLDNSQTVSLVIGMFLNLPTTDQGWQR